jgi:hypothetical protein
VHSAGAKSERPIVVQITDETGRPLEGVTVSFRLPEEGPSGVFQGGMKTDISITAADGRAAVHGMRWNRVEGPFQVRITAAKGESRAGAICSQYLSDTPAVQSFRPAGSGKKKWIALAAIAAGGAAAGLAIGMRGKAQTGLGSSGPSPVQIGLPTITIGRP